MTYTAFKQVSGEIIRDLKKENKRLKDLNRELFHDLQDSLTRERLLKDSVKVEQRINGRKNNVIGILREAINSVVIKDDAEIERLKDELASLKYDTIEQLTKDLIEL